MTDEPSRPTDAGVHDDELIDGYSLEQLSDYLDAGRTPQDLVIDESPACRRALSRLERLRAVSEEILAADAQGTPAADESWFQSIISGLSREVRAGRAVPITHADPRVELTITEGAIRSLIRRAGDAIPGVIIGHTQLDGDIVTPRQPVIVNLTVTAFARVPLSALADSVRNAVHTALATHTELQIAEINVTVADIFTEASRPESSHPDLSEGGQS